MTEEQLKKLVDYVKELARQFNELEGRVEWLRSQFVAEGKGAAAIIDPEQHRADHDRIATLEAELAELKATVIANGGNFTAYVESKEPPFEEPREVSR